MPSCLLSSSAPSLVAQTSFKIRYVSVVPTSNPSGIPPPENAVSAFDAYPMPRVEDLIERLGNAKYLTTLDLCKGYWQVPLTETSKNLTTFRVPSGLYRFRTMPFGLHGAPATFQQLVDDVLRGADGYAAAYTEDHIQHLWDVLQRILKAGLVINARKCHITKTEVEWGGFKDPHGELPSQVPGVLGMNVIRRCYAELFGQHVSALFDSSEVSGVSESVLQALQKCHQASINTPEVIHGKVMVRGRKACRIPGGVTKIVTATCSEKYSHSTVLFEPLDSGLPAGLLASPALVRVIGATAYIPVVNVGFTDVLLYPRTIVGTLEEVHIVSLPAGVTEVPSGVATMASHLVSTTVTDQVEAIDLSSLPVNEQCQVRSLLRKYTSVFSAHDGDLGCTNLLSHDIPLLDEVPVRQRYRRIPPSEYEVVKEHINQLLESQVIRESSSPYASPIVLLRKKDGSLRMCMDYRQLNSKTRKDAFPRPRIEESLDALTGARWFSSMDLASGYNQVPVAEADRPRTAFCTPFGLFEWNRMPFGLCNAPSTFQRLIQWIFGDQQCQSLLLYLDDIVVFSSTVEQHLERLEVVLQRLQQEGLKAKLTKCAFFQQEVRYLGHVVSDKGVSTDPTKVEAVASWPPPSTVTELRSFLGFASCYRHFVEGFAKLAAPLHKLVAVLEGSKL
ncbi:uncharacterized protein LOC129350363 [Amphiprion ocellaris]|uniref:uncharacterized protein LOC129350363 n=1 Tax=Amphiprion ocellaris TaxID=80972 RepID=UPI0024116788|nr:uncharacterized protein LOC129350363 [Amphiprion ocellaris]